ncbi:ATP-dependent RNA helicase SPB4 [Ascoidea rubescens DSM 1968]
MDSSLNWDCLSYQLQPWIIETIKSLGYETMTPVQATTIPAFANNKDVVVEAVTGSGKTLAFVIPVLERVNKILESEKTHRKGHFYSVIILPTRELANQINNVFQSFLENYPKEQKNSIKTQLLVGSLNSMSDDLEYFFSKQPQILVGTPGRLLDFLSNSNVKCKMCDCIVLDEADKLLDISFELATKSIIQYLPKQRRTGLFSATISSAGSAIFKTGMTNPVKITVKNKLANAAPESLGLSYIVLKPENKIKMLLHILSNYEFRKVIVYFPTCISVTYFYNMLQYLVKKGFITESSSILKFFSLHGKLNAKPRMKTLANFTNDLNKSVLLTTDVAARGIDIPDVDLVVQIDPPTDPDMFLHRCGRTGRANKVGRAIVFFNEGREENYVDFMKVRKLELVRLKVEFDEAKFEKMAASLQEWVLEDRGRFEHSVTAYVAFVRYYSKHTASSIFRLQTLDYLGLARMYSLLRLPKMPETRHISREQLVEANEGWLISPRVDLETYAYSDLQREKARLRELQNLSNVREKNKRKAMKRKLNKAWSTQKEKHEQKQRKIEKREQKRERHEQEHMDAYNSSGEETAEDWKSLVLSRKKKKAKTQNGFGTFDGL